MRARRTYVESVPEEEEPIAVMLHYVNSCFGIVPIFVLFILAAVCLIAAFK